MKVIWEESDIRGGQLIRKVDCGVTGLWMISWRHCTSWEAESDLKDGRATSHRWGIVSLADGMFQQIGSGIKEAVATHLNNVGHYMPIELTDGLPKDFYPPFPKDFCT